MLRDQLARVLADYDNLRKRVDLDKKNFAAGWTDIIGRSLQEYLDKN